MDPIRGKSPLTICKFSANMGVYPKTQVNRQPDVVIGQSPHEEEDNK
jgi:hypothetical protein